MENEKGWFFDSNGDGFRRQHLCGLLPRAVKTDQTAERAGKTDNTIVKADKAKSTGRNSQIAQVGDQLELCNALVPGCKLLAK